MEKTPIEQLRELMPDVRNNELCKAEVIDIEGIVKSYNTMDSEQRNFMVKYEGKYFGDLAEGEYYESHPKAQKILRKVAGLVKRMV
tara:strand:- start:5430 stop:5687 length:258 start_codon:yes stop_codon:yes gene_type:complete